MGWTWYSGKACLLSGNEGDMILQTISQIAGTKYVIRFDIVGMTKGILRLNNYEEILEFTSNGSYAVIGTAINGTLVFTGQSDDDGLFDGCIDNVAAYTFSSLSLQACSPSISVQENQDDCLLLLQVSNSGTQLGMQWDDLDLKARINAKFAKVEYDAKLESFNDSAGDYITTYFDGKKNRLLQVEAAPLFIHDFLFMCRGAETVLINGIEYSFVWEEYPSITWNHSITEGTVELLVRKKNSRLNKTNCV